MFIKKKKKLWNIFLPVTGIFILLSLWFSAIIFLPDEINLVAGKEQNFQYHIPLKATVVEENVGVLQVNNEPVKDNIHIDLSQPFTVKSEKEGNAKVDLSLFGVVPLKSVQATVLPQIEVVPCGMAVGVTMETKGIMVLGTGFVTNEESQVCEPSKGMLKSGDFILKAGGQEMTSKEDLIEVVKNNGEKKMDFEIERKGENKTIQITPVFSKEDQCCKIGVWVRDSTQGIGTLTFYDPQTNFFGALGHGVYDIDTKELMSIKEGRITPSSISEVKKGEKGVPGELMGKVGGKETLGTIEKNTEVGLYGFVNEEGKTFLNQKNEAMPIAMQQEVQEGPATILSNIEGNEIKEYAIEIENVSRFGNNDSKGMTIKITDEALLKNTGGIVQGMSGSPIIQNGKLIGAVTHVFVQDPTKGYGIFIENMLKEKIS